MLLPPWRTANPNKRFQMNQVSHLPFRISATRDLVHLNSFIAAHLLHFIHHGLPG